jgi:hypothetical protein
MAAVIVSLLETVTRDGAVCDFKTLHRRVFVSKELEIHDLQVAILAPLRRVSGH